jgi:hypothetical protein
MQFEQKANEVVAALPWVKKVDVTMSAQPAQPVYGGELPEGLQKISNIIAVSSCKACKKSITSCISTNLIIRFTKETFGFVLFCSHFTGRGREINCCCKSCVHTSWDGSSGWNL